MSANGMRTSSVSVPRKPVGAAGIPRVHGQTGVGKAAHTVEAEAAADVGRDRHPVAFLDRDDGGAHLLDHPQRLMTDDHAPHIAHPPFVDVEVRPANCTRGDSQHYVGGCLDARIFDRFDGNLVDAPHNSSFHSMLLNFAWLASE